MIGISRIVLPDGHMTDFEAWLEISPGTHVIDITAEDYSDNSITQTFSVHIANEGQVFLTYDLNGNLLTRMVASKKFCKNKNEYLFPKFRKADSLKNHK